MEAPAKQTLTKLLHQINGLSIDEAMLFLSDSFPGKVTFSSSFSLETR